MNRLRRLSLVSALLFLPTGCADESPEAGTALDTSAPLTAPPYHITADAFSVEGELGSFTSRLRLEEVGSNLYELTVRIEAARPAEPPEFRVRWSLPAVDMAGFWNTSTGANRVNYYRNNIESRSTSGAPVIALYNPAAMNRLTVAVSDALNPVGLRSNVREEDARFHFALTFCSERMPETTAYEATVRIDARGVPYYEALSDVSDWWAAQPGYEPAPVPDAALLPLYSTWYSFHQNLDVEEVLAELSQAGEMGYELVIVDDGWQTLDSQRGYRYTGDWLPERIPDMRGFVDAVHELGMKFMLWYSVPLVGEEAGNFPRFRGKYLRHWESQGAYVLDPRYPEVREFIITTYLDAMEAWDLDGFKLDFIGMLAANDTTVLTAENGRDYASVNEATDRLMSDVMARLRQRNPEVLIEFRQPYIGPLMRKYGNMFRGTDAPNNAWQNRAEVTDVRLLGGNTAPHSDMFMWHPTEPVEGAALQFLNVLFAVPQLSVKLTQYPDDHKEMVAFWTRYWKQNRGILMRGAFIPSSPGHVYPVLMAHRDGRAIAGVYSDAVVRLPEGVFEAVDLVNAKGTESLVLELPRPLGDVEVVVFDTRGREVGRYARTLEAGAHAFRAPPSGLVEIRR
ncbi:glycoside hydrolase family 36 protein [Gemmatimonadota bacterium]